MGKDLRKMGGLIRIFPIANVVILIGILSTEWYSPQDATRLPPLF
jgi:NADH:ubiquinone oxidoreductase subunit 5 (subunit L)/multisubunit Na+/H+ antiporter MnhA subunit